MIRSNNFNGGPSSGATVTTGNSGGTSGDAFNYVNGSITYTNSFTGGTNRGPLVCSLPAASGTNMGWNSWSLSARTFYWRLYVYIGIAPNSDNDFSYAKRPGDTVAFLGINSSRQIYLQGPGGGQQLATTSALTLSQWVRIEARVTVGTTTSNGTAEIRLFNSADSASATDAPSGTGLNFGTTLPDDVVFSANSQFAVLLDSIGITDVDWFGPDANGVIPRPIFANPYNAVRRASFY